MEYAPICIIKATLSDHQDGFQLTDGTMFTDSMVDEDGDEDEDHTFSLDCESGTQTHRFYLDPVNAELVFNGDYDLDTEGTPDEISCVITVSDKYGLTDTAGIRLATPHLTAIKFQPAKILISLVF